VLVTGFGPFPGAPDNPSGALALRLARLRRPAFADIGLHAHVFATSYAAVDRELPQLLRRLRPRAILMFGLAARTPHLRIETQARNAVAVFPDAAHFAPPARSIVRRAAALRARLPLAALVRAARSHGLMARASFDAGRYVCNYLLWRGLEAAARPGGPQLVSFVHVPQLRPAGRRRSAATRAPGEDRLARTGEAILRTIIAAAQRPTPPGPIRPVVRHRH
jgi:pyroglutamyl-peptidase